MDLVFLAILSGILGIISRAYLDSKSSKLIFYHSILISPFLGYYAYLKRILLLIRNVEGYFAFGFVFFMYGWVLSDILESICFIAKAKLRKYVRH